MLKAHSGVIKKIRKILISESQLEQHTDDAAVW